MKNFLKVLACVAIISISFSAYAQRAVLTGPAIFYVNGDPSNSHLCGNTISGTAGYTGATLSTCSPGVDSTSCTTPSTACLTLNQAVQNIIFRTDLAGYGVTIVLAYGTSGDYDIACDWGPALGNSTFGITGDCGSPTSVVIPALSGTVAIFAKDMCVPSVQCLEITDGGSSTGAINVGQMGIIDLRSVTISGAWNSNSALINAEDGGKINMLGSVGYGVIPNTIAVTSAGQIFDAQNNGIIHFNGQQVSIPNSITIASGESFAEGYGGVYAGIPGTLFTGAGVSGTTGSKCYMDGTYLGGNNPNSVFPGNSNCSTSNIIP